MSILSEDNINKLKQLLVTEKFITSDEFKELEKKALEKKLPFLSYVVQEGKVNAEQLTKLTAEVLGLPYVNLIASKISPSVLNLLLLFLA